MKCRGVCASVVLAALAPSVFGQDALDSIDSCVRRLDPQTDVGYERIAPRCPDLARRLGASQWAAWLPQDWNAPGNDLSVGSLRELRVAAARELAMRKPERAPDPASLQGVLAGLSPLDEQRTAWWGRLTGWLRTAFERGDQSSADSWLDRTIARVGPSQALVQLISYAGLCAVVLLALGFIVNELRVAELFAPRSARTTRQSSPQSAPRRRTPDWQEIQQAPAGDRPGLLLESIVARLVELNRLPAAGGLTVRELTRVAHLASADERALLAGVALAAERVTFSAEQIPVANLEAAVAGGRELLEHLGA